MQNKRAVTFTLIHPSIYYPITFNLLYCMRRLYVYGTTLDSTVHVSQQIHGILTLKEPECGAMTPSNNSLRLTRNMKEPERGATTNSLRLTHNMEQRLLATTHSCSHIICTGNLKGNIGIA